MPGTSIIGALLISGLFLGLAPAGITEPVRNGNELALAWSASNAANKPAMRQQVTGRLYTFRYLRVTAIQKDRPDTGAMTVVTVEPSSDMQIALVLTKRLSLELAGNLTTNDCVAAYGRIKTIGSAGANLIEVDPAILKHKDRATPKLTKELINEVDDKAR